MSTSVRMLKDDIVIVLLTVAGLDDRVYRNAERFDTDRKSHTNMIFGSGVHLRAEHYLAKLEVNILVEEWVRAPPSSTLRRKDNAFRLGNVMASKSLPLAWSGAAVDVGQGSCGARVHYLADDLERGRRASPKDVSLVARADSSGILGNSDIVVVRSVHRPASSIVWACPARLPHASRSSPAATFGSRRCPAGCSIITARPSSSRSQSWRRW